MLRIAHPLRRMVARRVRHTAGRRADYIASRRVGPTDVRTLTRLTISFGLLGLAGTTTLVTACTRNNPGSGAESTTTERHITVHGVQRTYRLHLPAHFDTIWRATPVVFVLHGHDDTAKNFERSTGMSTEADAAGFIAIYPQALGDPSDWHTAVDGPADSSDIWFIRAIIRQLSRRHDIDHHRIYVAGHSNGGFMAYRLASLMSDQIAAVGITAGSIGMVDEHGDTSHIAPPRHPVSVIHFHGKADPSVPYLGGPESDGPSNIISAPNTIRFWTTADGCPSTATTHTVSANANVTIDTYQPCHNATAVVLYTITDGTHQWPGGNTSWWSLTASDTDDVNATLRMWEFFAAHPRRD